MFDIEEFVKEVNEAAPGFADYALETVVPAAALADALGIVSKAWLKGYTAAYAHICTMLKHGEQFDTEKLLALFSLEDTVRTEGDE